MKEEVDCPRSRFYSVPQKLAAIYDNLFSSTFRGENVFGASDPLTHLHPPAAHLLHHQHHPLPCRHRTKPWCQEALHRLPPESF